MAISQSCLLTFLIEPPNSDPTLTWVPSFGPRLFFDFGIASPSWQIDSYDSGANTWDIEVDLRIFTYSLDGDSNLVGASAYSGSANLTGIATIGPGVHTFGVRAASGALQLTVDGWDVSTVSGAPRHGAYTSYTLTENALINGKYGPVTGQNNPFPAAQDGTITVGDLTPISVFPFFPGASPSFAVDDGLRTFFMNNSAPADPSLANLTVLFAQTDGAGFWTNRYLSTEF